METNWGLQFKNFSYFYKTSDKGGVQALENIDFSIKKGEFVAIVGPSGCGKSTLLSCVIGLLKSDNGSILLDGKAFKSGAKHCAMVFQSHSLFPWRTVLGNIIYGLQIQGKKQAEKKGKDLINLVGLSGFEHFYPHQLSGGMQQRVNLARALAIDPEILLLDEPFANLDAQTRELMQAELLKIWQKSHKTVLFVTHQINEAIFLADRVVVMSARPGIVKEIIDVNLTRPRSLEIKLSSQFIKLERHIWRQIMPEVKKGKNEETFKTI